MSLIDQQKDLENFSDQALLQEAMQPMRGYPPFLVAAEIQRRQQDRSRVQQQTMAAQPEAPPVAMQQAAQFANQMAPMAQPEPVMGGMPPEAGMGMAAPMMASAAPAEPVGIMGAAPVQAMAGGGEVKRMQEGKTVPTFLERSGLPFFSTEEGLAANRAALSRFFTPRRPGFVVAREAQALRNQGKMDEALSLLRQEGIDPRQVFGSQLAAVPTVATEAPAISEAPAATPSSAPGITSRDSRVAFEPATQASIFNVRPGTDFSGGAPTRDADVSTRDVGIPSIPISRRGDFMSTYRDVLGRIAPLETVGIQSRKDILEGRVTPQGRVALDPFYVEEAKRLEQFRPSREKFERGSQAEMLAGLGAIIGGATQRGDIAKGLAALTRQQREAERDFRREEREFAGFESGLRREERAEAMMRDQARAAAAREERQMSRQDISDALAMTQAIEANKNKIEELSIARQNLAAEIRKLNFEIKNAPTLLAQKEAKARLEAAETSMSIIEKQMSTLGKMFEISQLPGGPEFLQSRGVESSGKPTAAGLVFTPR